MLKQQLQGAVKEEWDALRAAEKGRRDVGEEWEEALEDGFVSVEVSERDRDPYGILVAKSAV